RAGVAQCSHVVGRETVRDNVPAERLPGTRARFKVTGIYGDRRRGRSKLPVRGGQLTSEKRRVVPHLSRVDQRPSAVSRGGRALISLERVKQCLGDRAFLGGSAAQRDEAVRCGVIGVTLEVQARG